MKFKANDIVSYAEHGVCKVVGVVKRASLTDENKTEYYELRPVENPESKIFIPVSNETLIKKMDKVLSAKEIKELVDQAVTEGLIWTDDKAERQVQYRAILDRGDRTELIRLVRTLDLRQKEARADNKKIGRAHV